MGEEPPLFGPVGSEHLGGLSNREGTLEPSMKL
jgi:hypothetical protein